MSSLISRRAALSSSLALAAAGASRGAFAQAAPERSALIAIFLQGGFNALFGGSDAFVRIPNGSPKFGVSPDTLRDLGNSVVVDKETFGTLPDWALGHMANIGVRHNITDHVQAQYAGWTYENRSAAVHLAAALGESTSVPLAMMGGNRILGARGVESGVSFQNVYDIGSVLRVLGARTSGEGPRRELVGRIFGNTAQASQRFFDQNPNTAADLQQSYQTSASVLARPSSGFNYDEVAAAYGLPKLENGEYATELRSFASKMAGAELAVRTGTNVAAIIDDGTESGAIWDTHFVTDGSVDRNLMKGHVLTPLRTLLSRMQTWSDLNCVVAIFGDFARTLPFSDHAASFVATVFGKYVKLGTTGRMQVMFDTRGNPRGDLPASTPGIAQFWAYLSAVLKVPGQPFGKNPHQLIVRS